MLLAGKKFSIKFVPERSETCIYCGAPLDGFSVCDCEEREKSVDKAIESLNDFRLDSNYSLSMCEMIKVKRAHENEWPKFAYDMYKLGFMRGIEAERGCKKDR